MKTSFSTLACPDWSFEQVLAAAVRYGFDGVELRVLSGQLELWKLPEFQPAAIASTRRSLQASGLQVVCLGSSACFHSPDAAERARNMDAALRMAELAARLDAAAVRVFPDRIQPGCDRAETTAWIAESLVTLAEKLNSSNVEVWLETHGDFATADAVTALLHRTQREDVGIIWDPANAFLQSGEAPLLTPEMKKHLRHVHVKDVQRLGDGEMRYVAPGEGEFPLDTLVSTLNRAGYDAFLSFEWEKQWHPELAPADVALPDFIRWWKATQ